MATVFDISQTPQAQNFAKYRRPVLQYNSSTTVAVQDQIVTGVGGDCTVLFSDGKLVTVNSTTQTLFDITRNAALSGTKQSGLRTGSVANNTWYALYAVRATDNDNTWVTVGDTVQPVNSQISTLNTNFGAGKWCYLGMIRYGDNASSPSVILAFDQSGSWTQFRNIVSSDAQSCLGLPLAKTSGSAVSSINWSYSGGTGATQVPQSISIASIRCAGFPGSPEMITQDSAQTTSLFYWVSSTSATTAISFMHAIARGVYLAPLSSTRRMDIVLQGWSDGALGVGTNPLV